MEGKSRRAVDTLTQGKYGVEIVEVVDDEVEGLETAVGRGVHEIDHLDVVLAHISHYVVAGELRGGLAQLAHDFVFGKFD